MIMNKLGVVPMATSNFRETKRIFQVHKPLACDAFPYFKLAFHRSLGKHLSVQPLLLEDDTDTLDRLVH